MTAHRQRILSGLLVCLFMVAAFILFYSSLLMPGNRPAARHGTLDMTGWRLRQHDFVALNGQWEFYWNAQYTVADFNRGNPEGRREIRVPMVWTQGAEAAGTPTGKGFATYRLHLTGLIPGREYSMRVEPVSTAYRLFADDQLLAENGHAGTTALSTRPEYMPRTVNFHSLTGEIQLIMQVSNFTYARGGIWYQMSLGSPEAIKNLNDIIIYKDAMLIGGLLIMVLYYASFYLVLRRKDRSSLYFVLMCVVLITRTMLYGDYLFFRLFPELPFRFDIFLTYMTFIWFAVLIFLVVRETFAPGHMKRLVRGTVAFGLGATVFCAVMPVGVYTRMNILLEGICLMLPVLALGICFRAYADRVPRAQLILPGASLITVTGFHDALYQNNYIAHPYGEMTSLAQLIFLMLMAVLLAQQFSESYLEAGRLSEELQIALAREKEYSERLSHVDRLKDEFLANTSHELRTPLNGIINISRSMLKGVAGTLSTRQEHNIQLVVDSASRLYRMIDDLLDIASIRHNDIRIDTRPLEIGPLVLSVLRVMEYVRGDKPVRLISALPDHLPRVMADEERLRQILFNLVGNAVKFTDNGHVTLRAAVNGPWMCLSVEDTGQGIAREDQARIFEAFEQGDASVTRHHGGTGLGLYITRRLVELHGGMIRLVSEPGRGSTFMFTLPVTTEPATDPTGEFRVPEAWEQYPMRGRAEMRRTVSPGARVLVVEDDPVSLEALTNFLELEQLAVIPAQNGYDAVSILATETPDMVILDLMMPGMSGFEVLEHIRSRFSKPELPVLMLTARNRHEDVAAVFSAGASDFMEKPFMAEELLLRVRNLISLRQAVEEKVTSELAFLHAQIKPHFVFNALSVIASLSLRNPERAKSLILDLSDYLRISFDIDNKTGMCGIQDELNLVHAYLSIEEARFGERLKTEFQVDAPMTASIPMLVLQPLVENAVRHGVMPRPEGGTIRIRITRGTGCTSFRVSDDGLGMKPELVEQLLDQREPHGQRGVGMINIHRRLKMLYGHGLHIQSAPGRGTTISFDIPDIRT